MTAQVVHFGGLSDQERKAASRLPKLASGDRVELRVRREGGAEEAVSLPPSAVDALGSLLSHLSSGQRVAVLAEDQEVSPTEAATILGISRPLVVHRMEIGDLAFRYVGKHRRARLRDVLALKEKLDAQRTAMQALAEDAEDLHRRYGL